MPFYITHSILFILSVLVFLPTLFAQTCSSTSPCTEGCCSIYGICGFGPAFCGTGNCTSSCDAQAQCGQFAPSGSTDCPLNVCCSQFGFCGTTSDFCGTGCQNGCAVPVKPSCSSSGGSTSKRTIGYYESWSYTRTCDTWDPTMIDATKWTHLNYGFALIHPDTFELVQMNSFDVELYPRFTALKQQNPSLQTFISVGGWAAGGQIFSEMTSDASNRAAFIASAITFMKTFAFDGIDIDWEYPVASDRGGSPADFENYVTFLQELRAACGSTFGLTATIPSSYWYMQGFDIVNMEPSLDWFNIMTYDIHGTWDGDNPFTQAVVQAHTNLTDIDQALDLLWRNNIDSSKVVLGLAFYGRSFTLRDSSCNFPGCPFASGGNPGQCTQTSGILSNAEIQSLMAQYDIIPTLDSNAAVKYMTWNDSQWVSYDDAQTLAMKVNYANNLCLGGTMVWALDLDDSVNTTSIDNLNSNDLDDFNAVIKSAIIISNAATLGIFWTPCLQPGTQVCPNGYDPIVAGHGKVFDADLQHLTGEGCHGGGNGFNRVLCAPSNVQAVGCQWGPGRIGKSCNSKCPSGWLTVTKNSHIAGQKSGCKTGTYAPLCCQSITAIDKGWCYATTLDHILSGSFAARDNSNDVTSFSFSANKKQRVMRREEKIQKWTGTKALSKRAGSGLECFYATYQAMKGIAVEVPGQLDVTYLDNGYYSASISPIATPSPTTKRGSIETKIVPVTAMPTTIYQTFSRVCDGSRYPQPCHHYSSVAQYGTFARPTCAPSSGRASERPLVDFYDSTDGVTQHNSIWSLTWITKTYVNPNNQRVKPSCQRDEWPPAHFQQGRPDGYIRLLPGSQNGGIANTNQGGWKGFCQYPPKQQLVNHTGQSELRGRTLFITVTRTPVTTLNVMDYQYTSMSAPPWDQWLLTANPCYPSTLTHDPGFALLTWDPWYGPDPTPLPYSLPPTAQYTAGKRPPRKRDLGSGDDQSVFVINDDGAILVDEGNSTRKASDEEILEYFDLRKCKIEDCAAELEEYAKELEQIRRDALLPSSKATDESTITAPDRNNGPTLATWKTYPTAVISGSNPSMTLDIVTSTSTGVGGS